MSEAELSPLAIAAAKLSVDEKFGGHESEVSFKDWRHDVVSQLGKLNLAEKFQDTLELLNAEENLRRQATLELGDFPGCSVHGILPM